MEDRVSRQQMWLMVASSLACRSHDDKVQVGAVITDFSGNLVMGTGYNGHHSGGPNSRLNKDAAYSGDSGLIHAEVNALVGPTKAIVMAERFHIRDASMYVTHSPCMACANTIIAAGFINRISYIYLYKARDGTVDRAAEDLLRSAGITVERVFMDMTLRVSNGVSG